MAVKVVYIHPGDMLDVRFVFDKESKPNKLNFNTQSYHQMQYGVALLTMTGPEEFGFHSPGTQVALMGVGGKVKRWLV